MEHNLKKKNPENTIEFLCEILQFATRSIESLDLNDGETIVQEIVIKDGEMILSFGLINITLQNKVSNSARDSHWQLSTLYSLSKVRSPSACFVEIEKGHS